MLCWGGFAILPPVAARISNPAEHTVAIVLVWGYNPNIGISDYQAGLVMSRLSNRETSKVGKRGTVVIPAKLRKRFGIVEGSLIIAEETGDGILIRPAVALPVESYSSERIAEFILSNAVDSDDYGLAIKEVRRMGLDPESIPHRKPE